MLCNVCEKCLEKESALLALSSRCSVNKIDMNHKSRFAQCMLELGQVEQVASADGIESREAILVSQVLMCSL